MHWRRTALVIYNENDPLSRDLAAFYADQRGIPAERVVSLKCPIEEEISRQQYDDTIARPLRALFDERHWWLRSPDKPDAEPSSVVSGNRIHFLVLMRGMPLRIKGTPPSLTRAISASFPRRSEIATRRAWTRNSRCWACSRGASRGFSRTRIINRSTGSRRTRFPGIMLTGRLDAPTGSTVRQMILDTLAAEKNGLWGRCYLDGRGIAPNSSPMAEGDQWIDRIASDRAPYFLPTITDHQSAMFPTAYPMNAAAMYFGWYSQDVAGPFTREDFHFVPGAVAVHIHSYSATTLRDTTHYWVGPLIDKGASASLGNVYEPYLTLTTHLDIFADRLFDGFTLAESAWAATPGFSWMNTVVGDPLYRPGLYWKNQEFSLDAPPPTAGEPAAVVEGRAYWQGAQIWRSKGAQAGIAALEKSAARLHSGRIYEGLALLLANGTTDVGLARHAFEQAARSYSDSSDVIRVVLDEARFLAHSNRRTEAVQLLTVSQKKYAGKPAVPALDEALTQIAGEALVKP